jgi:type IV secretion system protein VirB3
MQADEQQQPIEYISYNGLGRNPSIWGVPYMTGLIIMSVSLLGGMLLGTFVGPAGWLFALIGIPLILFVKMICMTDDKAVGILLLEAKWVLIKALSGNARFHGGTMAIAPTTYGRKLRNVKRYFEKAARG